jgi:hypothetical protein
VRSKLLSFVMSCVAGLCLCFGVSYADTSQPLTPPFADVHTLAAPDTPVPVEHDFSITTAGSYQIVLTDLGALYAAPIPMSAVMMAVTTGGSQVGHTLGAPGTFQFNATAGSTYTVHVVGTPGASSGGVGVIGLQVGTAANPTSIASFSDNVQASASLPPGTAILDDSFTVNNSGSYVISLTDLNLPQNLATLTLALTVPGQPSSQPVAILPDPNNNNAMQATVSLSTGTTYRITAIGAAGAANAGLYSAVVTPQGAGTPVYGKAIPLGATLQVGAVTLAAGNHTLILTDLTFPASLTQFGAMVLLNGQRIASLSGAGTQSFSSPGGSTYQVFAVALPQSATPSAGAYSLQIQPAGGGSPEFAISRAVTGAGSNLAAFSFDSTLQSAGSYAVELTDFSFPYALNSVRLAAVQNGALVGTALMTAGTLNLNAQVGPITYLVIAQGDPSGGLFDLNVTATGNTALLFDVTQGVNAAFISRKVSVTATGTYGISSSDLGFPTSFSNLSLMVTQGANNLGRIFSLGNLTLNATVAGDYFINLIAQPAAAAGISAGTYSLQMAPAPTVSFNSSAMSVNQGGTVTLSWSVQNATSCTAKDGWSGTQQLPMGTFQTPPLTANTLFTLSCTGVGGTTTTQSLNITVASAPAKGGGGGGGAIDAIIVLGLTTLVARRLLPHRKRART